jgi:RNA polymerase sigma factor (sigma-70 family)
VSLTFPEAWLLRGGSTRTGGSLRPWLLGIATNLVHGAARTERRRYRALARAGAEPPTAAGSDEVHARVDAAALRGPLADALAGLKERDRDVLLLVAWGQLGYEEIAAVLEIPVGTVRSRLNRARRQTRAALGPFEETR